MNAIRMAVPPSLAIATPSPPCVPTKGSANPTSSAAFSQEHIAAIFGQPAPRNKLIDSDSLVLNAPAIASKTSKGGRPSIVPQVEGVPPPATSARPIPPNRHRADGREHLEIGCPAGAGRARS